MAMLWAMTSARPSPPAFWMDSERVSTIIEPYVFSPAEAWVPAPAAVVFSSPFSIWRTKMDSKSLAALSNFGSGASAFAGAAAVAELIAPIGFIGRLSLHEARQRPLVLAGYLRALVGTRRAWKAIGQHRPRWRRPLRR